MKNQIHNQYVELRKSRLGTRAFVAGHRIRIQDIVLWHDEGLSADEIISRVPTLRLAEVHAALAFYYDNRAAIDQEIRDDRQFSENAESEDYSARRA